MNARPSGAAGQPLPWADQLVADGFLADFLDELLSAALRRWYREPDVPDETVLADVRAVLARWEAETTDTPAAPSVGRLEGTVTAAAEVERLRVMYRVVSEREHDLINERDRLLTEADAAQARIAELVAQRDDALRDLATGDLPDAVPAEDRAAVLREAYEVAHEEGHRIEAVAGIQAARGARCVAYRLRRMAEATQADAAGAGEEL
ncbi:hypothetical protein RM780_07660 [Streptomyces sp. DSM 44917]|uniref:Uncharacterized protein n=1 Tax=Streptomyces boetiae TaxID=3075541 RepID=A0ABU2L691_9ACTN|nr:hypothetical protein [Streptomyces sp. DSM 44917]MDT0306838.1 hypothetical protein [Streptomyces sp. DSM 44917]